MKAILFSRFGGAEVLEYVDLPRPSPEKNEMLIEVTAAGVNSPDKRERQAERKSGVPLTRGNYLYIHII
jgi:NADPH:quinone reductase